GWSGFVHAPPGAWRRSQSEPTGVLPPAPTTSVHLGFTGYPCRWRGRLKCSYGGLVVVPAPPRTSHPVGPRGRPRRPSPRPPPSPTKPRGVGPVHRRRRGRGVVRPPGRQRLDRAHPRAPPVPRAPPPRPPRGSAVRRADRPEPDRDHRLLLLPLALQHRAELL